MPSVDSEGDPVATKDSSYSGRTGWSEGDSVSIVDFIERIHGYRRVIATVAIAVASLYLLVSFLMVLLSPSVTMVALNFHLNFEGVSEGRYPNGTKFGVQDIVSVPVLGQVHEANDLEQFLPMQEFSDALFIAQENHSAELLDKEYLARLSDSGLKTVERLRLEEEYRAKRNALKAVDYSLNFVREQGRLRIPTTLVEKVLPDILKTWANHADQRRGILKYKKIVYSPDFIRKELLNSEDYVVAADILRSRTRTTLGSLDGVAELPGAEVIRVGEEGISLAEVKIHLQDILRLRLEPLLMFLRTTGVSKDPRTAARYFETRFAKITSRLDRANEEIEILEEALDRYLRERPGQAKIAGSQGTSGQTFDPSTPALIPQFSASFLDRLVEMSTESNDLEFRQDLTERIIRRGMERASLEQEGVYYKESMKKFSGFKRAKGTQEETEFVKSRMGLILSELSKALGQLQNVYEEVSTQNLNPSTLLYKIAGPSVVSVGNSASLKSLALSGVLSVFLAVFLTVSACLVHGLLRGHSPDTSRNGQATDGQ